MTPFAEILERRLDPGASAPLAVALSGGGDSLALLHLTLDWANRNGRPVLALTVDHGLNSESAGWTAEAGARAKRLGADWQALAWAGPKPSTGIQARARSARHALLAQAARTAGARVLLMGHTADDIAESEAMRASDAPGLGRLREWSPSPAWPAGRGVFLLRPLLGVRRADLRAYLEDRGAQWHDDPANADRRFARVRARQTLAARTDAPQSQEALDLDPAIPALAHSFWFSPDAVHAALHALTTAPPAIARPVVAAALLSVSGTDRPPRRAELDRLLDNIAAGAPSNLAGCWIAAHEAAVSIVREPPRRGRPPRAEEPMAWVQARFEAACGLVPCERSAPSV